MVESIEIDGRKLFFERSGPENGTPVILMHGWGCNHSTVKSIADDLNSYCCVYSLDLPGHGDSPEPPEVWGVEKYTEMVEKFIQKMNIRKPTLIGHSFGGRIAILLSSRNDVDKVVLVDAAGIKPTRPLSYYIKVYSFKLAKRIFPILLGKKNGEALIRKWRSKAGSADYNNASPMMKAILSKCVNEDLKKVMPRIKAPVLLIWGEKDTATPLKDAKQMERLIADAGLVAFPNCGHYSFLDNPYQFKAVIQSFLPEPKEP